MKKASVLDVAKSLAYDHFDRVNPLYKSWDLLSNDDKNYALILSANLIKSLGKFGLKVVK